MSKNINELFITDEVKNYIKHGNNFIKKGEKVYKNNINFSLYIGLLKFIEKISKFDIIGIQNLYIEFFKNIINSTENIDIKKRKINDYIKFLEVNLINKKIFIKRIENIQKELENILKVNDNNDKTIENFITFLNKDENDKKYLELNNKIREQLINNSENAYLFLEFFDIIKCNDEKCENNQIINNYTDEDIMFTLKRDGDIIKLLKIFKNDSINVIVNEEDMQNIISSKNKYQQDVIELTKKYINIIITAIKSVFIKGGNKNIQKGGLFELFNITKFYELFENMIDNFLKSLYDNYESFFNKLTGMFKIDWFNEGGINTIADVIETHDYNDVKDNFVFRFDNIGDYISNYFNSFFSEFIKDTDEQKNFISETIINTKKNTLLYLEDRSKLQKKSLSGIGITSVSGKALNTFVKEGLGTINSMLGGGGKNKCLKIPNLRYTMYSVLMNTHDIKMEFDISNYKECDEKIEEDVYTYSEKNGEKFNCLNKTNLYRKNKKNSSKLKVWDMNNRNLNYQPTLVFPDYVQILKDTVFPNYLNYQLGGDINNEKSKKTEIISIDIERYFDIVSILENILKNKNKYLKSRDIINIEDKIINVKKISEELKKYNKKLDDNLSLEYKNKQDILNEKLNKLISELNNEFIKIVKSNNE